ncbi:MAG: UTP--glucose-1-phosphate uridylyltransferase [Rhodobiaceae bacterium UBA7378]|nr:MAG: UTP--glucose-1-phosphate uridylyltransferase [Rhodobiaceae bacterium UBA7378]
MKALLLAAGRGARLRPLTDKTPKCLVPVCGKPLLQYWLEMLVQADIDEIFINTWWLSEQVEAFIKTSPFRERVVLLPEAELRGTAGTLKTNFERWKGEDLFVAHADNLVKFDMTRFVAAHRARPAKCELTLLSFIADDPKLVGVLELDEQNIVVAFHEKVENPPSNLANGAVYLISPQVSAFASQLPQAKPDFSLDIIPSFIGRILAVELDGYLRDIGNPKSLKRAEREFASFV